MKEFVENNGLICIVTTGGKKHCNSSHEGIFIPILITCMNTQSFNNPVKFYCFVETVNHRRETIEGSNNSHDNIVMKKYNNNSILCLISEEIFENVQNKLSVHVHNRKNYYEQKMTTKLYINMTSKGCIHRIDVIFK